MDSSATILSLTVSIVLNSELSDIYQRLASKASKYVSDRSIPQVQMLRSRTG